MEVQTADVTMSQTTAVATIGATVRPGRNVVQDRALHKVVAQAVADEFGLDRKRVNVTISAARGGMAVSAASPLPIPRLDDDEAVMMAVPIVDQIGAAQSRLRERIGELTGRDVARVNITITGAIFDEVRRVR